VASKTPSESSLTPEVSCEFRAFTLRTQSDRISQDAYIALTKVAWSVKRVDFAAQKLILVESLSGHPNQTQPLNPTVYCNEITYSFLTQFNEVVLALEYVEVTDHGILASFIPAVLLQSDPTMKNPSWQKNPF